MASRQLYPSDSALLDKTWINRSGTGAFHNFTALIRFFAFSR
jgi:hypothetical protein